MHTQLASALVLALASLSHADPIVHYAPASPVSVGAFSLYPPTGFYDFVFNYSQGVGGVNTTASAAVMVRNGVVTELMPLTPGTPITAESTFSLSCDRPTCSGSIFADAQGHGLWLPGMTGLIGCRFVRASEYYYGWMRVHLPTRENEPVQVLEWAYQAQPNLAIAAGDAGVPTCPPQIIAMTPPMEVEIGTFVELPVRAAGENLSYQWLRNGESIDPEDPSTTGSWTDTLVIFSTVPEDTLAYTLRVTSSCGTVTTDPVMLVVAPPPPICPPFVVDQPENVTAVVGSMTGFGVEVAATDPSFQWYHDGVPLSDDGRILGSTTSLLTIVNATLADRGEYQLAIHTECGDIWADDIILDVGSECSPIAGGHLLLNAIEHSAAVVQSFGSIVPSTEITIEFWQLATEATVQATFNMYPVNEASRFLFHAPFSDGMIYWDLGECNPDFGSCTTFGRGRLAYLPPEPITGAWQHFALVASQSGNFMRIYRNGVLEAVKAEMSPVMVDPADALMIGGAPTYHGFLNGRVDEFRVWNYARTGAEIAAGIATTIDPASPGLVAYYRFDETDGLVAHDLAAGAHHALLTGGAAFRHPFCCVADFNADGSLDPDDLGDYINCYFGAGVCNAEFNNDGTVNPDDLGDFINAYFSGC